MRVPCKAWLDRPALLYCTGLHAGEAPGLQWQDIDFAEGTVTAARDVDFSTDKTGALKSPVPTAISPSSPPCATRRKQRHFFQVDRRLPKPKIKDPPSHRLSGFKRGSGDWIRTSDTSGMNRMLWPTELRRHSCAAVIDDRTIWLRGWDLNHTTSGL